MEDRMGAPRFSLEPERQPPLRALRPIEVVSLSTTVSTIVEARSDQDFHILHLWLGRRSGSGGTFSVYLVPAGGSPGASNAVYSNEAAPSGGMALTALGASQYGRGMLLSPGMRLMASASASNALNIWGMGADHLGGALDAL